MNKNIPYFIVIFFSFSGTAALTSHKVLGDGHEEGHHWQSGERIWILLPGSGAGGTASPWTPPSFRGGRRAGAGCVPEHTVLLAATPKPAGIIYGADFLQVALWGDGADPSSGWERSGRVSWGAGTGIAVIWMMSFKKTTLVFSSRGFCVIFSMQTN